MTDGFENFKSKERRQVYGTTMIEHKLRLKMKLSCNEFVMVNAIHKMMIKGKDATNIRITRWTGFSFENKNMKDPLGRVIKDKDGNVETFKPALLLLHKLKAKGFIDQHSRTKQIIVTAKYQAKTNLVLEDDFEFFWMKRETRRWTGSKSEGKKQFLKLSITKGSTYLIEQKEKYFLFLEHHTNKDRPIMNVTTFLNEDKERYAEPWDEYLDDIRVRAGESVEVQKKINRESTGVSLEEKEQMFD